MLIAQNMDHAEFEYAEYGFCRIWIKQNLDHAEFKCADRVEFGSSIFGLKTFFLFSLFATKPTLWLVFFERKCRFVWPTAH